uniref:Jupiter microtubule associated homolog 2 n=1 Tax=Cynoglossus semilaevis TaxID=244447 RepID=A0A3P8W5P3_CYNSE
MTSTNTFQGLESGSKPSSRVLQPPGGGSSNLFGGYEDDAAASRRPNKMASKVFSPPEETQNVPRRSNPPGGKTSGIFGDSEPPAQPQRPVPPGGTSNVIFGAAGSGPEQSPKKTHPNKPKDNLSVGPEPEIPAPEPKVSPPEVKVEVPPPAPVPPKEQPAVVPVPSLTSSSPPPDETIMKNHEPHLGPKPRSHNRTWTWQFFSSSFSFNHVLLNILLHFWSHICFSFSSSNYCC